MTISVKPEIFNRQMVRALLREIEAPGTGKTQTRRNFKLMGYPGHSDFGPSDTKGYDWHFRDKEMRFHDFRHNELMKLSPYQIGQLRWVRENFRLFDHSDECGASDHCACPSTGTPIFYADGNDDDSKWTPSIHMPRWASRITLEVTDVRVQRLQDISEEDAKAEGVDKDDEACDHIRQSCEDIGCLGPTFKCGFADLWCSINGDDSWRANPWLWAVTFVPHLINVDRFIKEREAA